MVIARWLLWFRRVCWLGVVIWLCVVFLLSAVSGPELEGINTMKVWDKALHFIAFFAGSLALAPALRLSFRWPWRKTFLVCVATISLYGALDEVHQLWTPGRSALNALDWVADTLGAIPGTALALFIHAKLERKNRPAPKRN